MNDKEIDYVKLSEESMAFGRKCYGLSGEPDSLSDILTVIIASVISLVVSVVCPYYFGIECLPGCLIFSIFLLAPLALTIGNRWSRISFILDRTGFHAYQSSILPRNVEQVTLPLEEITGFSVVEQKSVKREYLLLYIQLRDNDYRTTYCSSKTDENRQRLEQLVQSLHSILSQLQNREITTPEPPVQEKKTPSLLPDEHDIFSSRFVPFRKRLVIDETEKDSSITPFSCRGWTKISDESGNTYTIKRCPHFLRQFLLTLLFFLLFLIGSLYTCPKSWFYQGADITFFLLRRHFFPFWPFLRQVSFIF